MNAETSWICVVVSTFPKPVIWVGYSGSAAGRPFVTAATATGYGAWILLKFMPRLQAVSPLQTL